MSNPAATTIRINVAVASSKGNLLMRGHNCNVSLCGFCTSYLMIDASFLTLQMLERHGSEFINAPGISHNIIPGYYNLGTRAIFITDLIAKKFEGRISCSEKVSRSFVCGRCRSLSFFIPLDDP
jgi:hypothetical protein